VVLAEVGLPVARARRLAELGLRRGAQERVVQRTAGGGRVVAVGGARVALDRATLVGIAVLPAAA
jgi:ferrous iron transport protein A